MTYSRSIAICGVTVLAALMLASDVLSQTNVPRFETKPCPPAPTKLPPEIKPECGSLVVARDRTKPAGSTFRLEVVIFRWTPKSAERPLVLLHGGPSGQGGIFGTEGRLAMKWAPKLKRDVIVYDQRGAGISEPRLCAEIFSQPQKVIPGADANAGMLRARECIANLKAKGIDPDTFGSEISADDLAELRKVLAIPKWDIVGVSYGGRLTQEAIRRDREGIGSVVMHSSMLMTAASESDLPLIRQRLVERVFSACKADAECSSAFPTFETDFYSLYKELNEKPVVATTERAGSSTTMHLDGYRFLRTATNPANIPISKMPLFVKELMSGDRMRVAQYLLARRLGGGVANNVLSELVVCYDGYGSAYQKRMAEIKKEVRPEFQILENDLSQCPVWHSRFASEADHKLVKSDVPALILTTEFDDRTPTYHGKMIAAGLKNSYHFELPGLGHGVGISNGCGESIVLQFLQNPTQKPDASCIASMPRIKFELKNLY